MTINGHTLFHWSPNWSSAPSWRRQWESGLSISLTGRETRSALRSVAREKFGWTVTPVTLEDRLALDKAVEDATKSGLGCVPRWGRGFLLDGAASGTSFDIEAGAGAKWKAGDWVFLDDGDGNYDAREVTDVTDDTLTVAELSRTYPANAYVWRLVFGRFEADPVVVMDGDFSDYRLTVEERTSRDAVEIGSVTPPGGSGIGVMVVEDDFTVT